MFDITVETFEIILLNAVDARFTRTKLVAINYISLISDVTILLKGN